MKRLATLVVTGLTAAMLAGSGASPAAAAHHRRGHGHAHRYVDASGGAAQGGAVRSGGAAQGGAVRSGGDPAATPGSIGGLFGGLGGAYDNSPFGYDGPLGFGLRAKAQLGSALVGGGAAGDAYTDYLQHYYYYKYDACPLGSKYVWYLRRCFSPLDLFR